MICFLLGQGASYGLSGLFVQTGHGKSQVGNLMVFNAVVSIFSLVMVWIFLKDKKKIEKNDNVVVRSVKDELVLLSKDFHFVCLMIGSGIHMGVGNYFGVIIEILVKDSGLTAKDASAMGVITICSGLVSTFNCSLMSSRYNKYKIFITICTAGAFLSYILFYFVMRTGNYNLAMVTSFIFGIFLLPVFSLPLELACESTYPVREILTSGLITCIGQLFSLIPIVISYHFNNTPKSCIMISAFFQLISLISIFFSKEELKRQQAELQAKAELVPSYN